MRFKHLGKPLICKYTAEKLLKAKEQGLKSIKISFDLGRSLIDVCLNSRGVVVNRLLIDWGVLREVAEGGERDIYVVDESGVHSASIAGRHFYKLVLSRWGHAPTIEIDGIHMHRVKDVTPEVDAEMKVRLLGRIRCGNVLDTCMGLGYTVIAALRHGACRVTTIEVDENVLTLAQLNPWSRELEDERVEVRVGDSMEILEEYDEEFDAAIHDPPRFSLAGELYGLEFYRKLAKALKPGGRIVHYVGQPGIVKGRRIWRGVLSRMRAAGFDVRYDPNTRCIYGKRVKSG